MYGQRTLADFSSEDLALARARVGQGAQFFNQHFPGWQRRLREADTLLCMETYDYCAAALAAYGRKGPRGQKLYSHGDVVRAYRGFSPITMGTQEDGFISYELLELLWKEAAVTVPPLPLSPAPPPTFWKRLRAFFQCATAFA